MSLAIPGLGAGPEKTGEALVRRNDRPLSCSGNTVNQPYTVRRIDIAKELLESFSPRLIRAKSPFASFCGGSFERTPEKKIISRIGKHCLPSSKNCK